MLGKTSTSVDTAVHSVLGIIIHYLEALHGASVQCELALSDPGLGQNLGPSRVDQMCGHTLRRIGILPSSACSENHM